MPVDTGPDRIDFAIPEVDLGDTFNTWRDITNTSVYKLNKVKLYEGLSSGTVNVVVSDGGTAQFRLQDNILDGVCFAAHVVFGTGVTFNGPVTFNAPTFTVNANIVTIDDYNLILGDTSAASDANIQSSGGGGLFINRGSGRTAEWVYQPKLDSYSSVYGLCGAWMGNVNIGLSGASAGIVPFLGTTLAVHGSSIRLDGISAGEHGFQVNLIDNPGKTGTRKIEFSRYSPTGSTAFIDVMMEESGLTYGNPYVFIKDGVNRKTVRKNNHGFVVGTPIVLTGAGSYEAAKADTSENAEVIGLVSRNIDNNTFELTFIGEVFNINPTANVAGTGLLTGSVYYLSPYVQGKLTESQPTQQGVVHKAVLIATSTTSGVVIPWTGGVLTQPLVLGSSTNTSVRIAQYNKFRLGDVVRYRAFASPTGLTYNIPSGITGATYDYGIFVVAQANTTTEAEVAGIVVSTEQIAGTSVNRAFNLMMDGFFEFPQGVSAINSGSAGSLQTGTVYFLNTDCAGTTQAYEGRTACYNNSSPTQVGYVRKPMLYAISPTKGYLFSYRGDVTGLPGISANVPLESLLIRNLASDQNGDLVFGVYSGGVNGGKQVMVFDNTTKGNVRIGDSNFTSSSVGAGATLSVAGSIFAGDTFATQGSVMIASRYTGPFPQTLNVIGSEYSTGNTVVSYGVRPSSTSSVASFKSTFSSTSLARTAIETGIVDGTGVPKMGFLAYYNTAHASPGITNTAVGTDVPLYEVMTVTPIGLGFGTNSAGASLDVNGTGRVRGRMGIGPNSETFLANAWLNFGNNYENTSTPDANQTTSTIRMYSGAGATYGLSVSDSALNIGANQSGASIRLHVDSAERARLTASGLGIGTSAPGASFDVEGSAIVAGPLSVNSTGLLPFSTVFGVSGGSNLYVPSKLGPGQQQYCFEKAMSWASNSADFNGALVIELPASTTSNGQMDTFIIRGYDYGRPSSGEGGGAWECVIGGYIYSAAASGWYAPAGSGYYINGRAPFTTVRLTSLAAAGTAGRPVIVLGNTNTNWRYPRLVMDVITGYLANSSSYGSGWSAGISTNLSTCGFTANAGVPEYTFPQLNTGLVAGLCGSHGIGTTGPTGVLEISRRIFGVSPTNTSGFTAMNDLKVYNLVLDGFSQNGSGNIPVYNGNGIAFAARDTSVSPLAAIYVGGRASGSCLNFALSSTYAQGLTAPVMTLFNNHVGIGITAPSGLGATASLEVRGIVKSNTISFSMIANTANHLVIGANIITGSTGLTYDASTVSSPYASPSTGFFTAPVDGLYQLQCQALCTKGVTTGGGGTTYVQLYFTKTGFTQVGTYAITPNPFVTSQGADSYQMLYLNDIVSLSAGQTVGVNAQVRTGLNVTGTGVYKGNYTSFSGRYIGRE